MTNEVQLDGIGLTQMIRPVPPFDTSTPPADGQALIWSAAASKYKPGANGGTAFNVKDYGAKGDNSTNDTAAIQAAINAADTAGGGVVFFPRGVYKVGALTCRPNIGFEGVSYDLAYTARGSRLSLIAGTNASMFTVPWGTPNIYWRDLHLEGNFASQSGTSWGIYFAYNPANSAPQTYQQSFVFRCSLKGFYSGGLYVGKWNEAVDVANSFIADNNGHGIQFETSDCAVFGSHILANGGDGVRLGNSSCMVFDCPSIAGNFRGVAIVSGGSDTVEFTQGTNVMGHQVIACHLDKNLREGVFVQGLNNQVTACFIGSNSQAANATYANVNVDGRLSDGTTSTFGNRVSSTFGNVGTSNKPNYHVLQSNYGASTNFVDISGSTFDLAGVTIDNLNDWSVHGQSGMGVHRVGHLVAQTYVNNQSNNLYTPTVAAGVAAGTSPPTPTLTNGTDLKGQLFAGTGTSPATGALVTLTFAKAYRTAPVIQLTPGNAATAAIVANVYVSTTTTTFTVSVVSALSASQAVGTYQWFYTVIG